jgi:hypothetical protein
MEVVEPSLRHTDVLCLMTCIRMAAEVSGDKRRFDTCFYENGGGSLRGTYANSQKVAFGNRIGVHGRVVRVCDRLRIDKDRGRTTGGNCQSSSGRRAGSRPANGTAPRTCGTTELLGKRENCPDV